MAYNPKNLSALSYANGFTLWHYKTTDAAADIDSAGYFNGASTMMRPGDFVFANASTGGTTESGVLIVKSNVGGVVDASNILSFGLINSD
ncbi:MAG TPA: hypothetical protein VFZ01_11595 [Geminicoccaceae bacterium]